MKKYAWKAYFLVLVMLVLLVFMAAGCNSPSATETTGEEQSSDGSAGVINLGFASAFTGAYGADGIPWYNAVLLAVDEMNAAGGPMGMQVKTFSEDDQSSVEEGIKAARKLLSVNKVSAIVGPSSDILLADQTLADQYKVPILSPCAGTTRLDNLEGRFHFRTCASDSWDAKVIAQWLKDQGYTKLGLLSQMDESRKMLADMVGQYFTQLGGTVVKSEYFNPNQPTYSAQLKTIFDEDPEIVLLSCGQEVGGTILEEWYKAGYGGKWILSSDMAVPEMFDFVNAKAIDGVYSEGPSAVTDSEWFQNFAKSYETKYSAKETPGAYVGQTYDAVILVGLAIEAGQSALGDDIDKNLRVVTDPNGEVVHTFQEGIDLLRQGKTIDYQGVGGPYHFDQYGSVGGHSAVWVGKDGHWEMDKLYGSDDINF